MRLATMTEKSAASITRRLLNLRAMLVVAAGLAATPASAWYDFKGPPSDGAHPVASLLADGKGTSLGRQRPEARTTTAQCSRSRTILTGAGTRKCFIASVARVDPIVPTGAARKPG
jgi:hypothetical protein